MSALRKSIGRLLIYAIAPKESDERALEALLGEQHTKLDAESAAGDRAP